MSKNWLSIITAALLVALSVVIFIARRHALGAETAGPRGWQVKLVVEGQLRAKDASLSTARAIDFRHQHIFGEQFQSGNELREPVRKRKSTAGRRTQLWRRQSGAGAGKASFRLQYTFQCALQGRPTPAMSRVTARIDAAPTPGSLLGSTPLIQTKDERIVKAARARVQKGMSPSEVARALYDYVADFHGDDAPEARTALGCLRRGGGGALGKSRLLIALCRSQGIPCRLLTGLVLAHSGEQEVHHWAEAWLEGRWLPMCPTYGHYGSVSFPENYVVLAVNSSLVVSGRAADYRATITAVNEQGEDTETPLTSAKQFWRRVSLYSLHSSEQHSVQFLLLLPLAALIVSFARTIIGIVTFGVFAPALIGLAFLDLQSLPWGLPIFALTVLAGWGIRHLLERYHLLQVPRVSAMLTLIVLLLLLIIVGASTFGITTTRYVSLFPLVILTFLVERFWTIEAEDSTAASFKTLLGTLAVAIMVSLALSPDAVSQWMFRYPETLGVVLAAQLLLGRYTGYRLTELYRFEDLIKEETPPGGQHELAHALASANGERHSGDQQPQRGLHPGPQPAPPLPPGGLQEPDGRTVSPDRRPDA